jgi:hypothetical protein
MKLKKTIVILKMFIFITMLYNDDEIIELYTSKKSFFWNS